MGFVDTKTIEPGGVVDAPLEYTLSSAEAIGVQAVSATFDGSAAAGAFLACCSFLAPDGRLIARCPTDASVAAGDVAEVTFAPFLGRGGGGGGGGVPTVSGEYVSQGSNTSIANNTTSTIVAPTHLSGPVLGTWFASAFHFTAGGLYAASAEVLMATTPWTAGGGCVISLASSPYNLVDAKFVTFPNNSGLAAFPQAIRTLVHYPPLTFAAGDQLVVIVQNLDGALALNFQVQLFTVQQYA